MSRLQAAKRVDGSNVAEWAEVFVKARLHEADAQYAAIRRGLLEGVPEQLLQIWTARQVTLSLWPSSRMHPSRTTATTDSAEA